ncbi:MAG: FecR domain-containing protein [Chloroflexi bacterium]|nr:FecR domain-containing protein [Chloroflexota bacterium]
MKKAITGSLCLVVMLLCACAAQPDQATIPTTITPTSTPFERTAVLSELDGVVAMRQPEEDDFSAAETGAMLHEEGQVQTGEESRVRLDVSDQSRLRLGPLTLFTLLGIEQTEDGLLTRIRLSFGELWVILQGGALEVETPSGLSVVRGSYMSVLMDEVGRIHVGCLEGNCRVSTPLEVVELIAGQSAILPSVEEWQEYIVSQDETPAPPGILLEYLTEQDVQEWLDFNPEARAILPALTATAGTHPLLPLPFQVTPDRPWPMLTPLPGTATPEHVILPFLSCLSAGTCASYCAPPPRPGCAVFQAALEAQGVNWAEFLACMNTTTDAQACADQAR